MRVRVRVRVYASAAASAPLDRRRHRPRQSRLAFPPLFSSLLPLSFPTLTQGVAGADKSLLDGYGRTPAEACRPGSAVLSSFFEPPAPPPPAPRP